VADAAYQGVARALYTATKGNDHIMQHGRNRNANLTNSNRM